ncbi:MAG: PD40 domain-containing protein [Candidatus Aminicenantes bacterium]|nr:PD40 domain-containing protein [Candidatus Aminicenantes bacterium]
MILHEHRGLHHFLLTLFAAGILTTGAAAQYFGRNKVQYQQFDFRILKTEHFDVYFYPEEEKAAHQAARLAERWHARLSRLLGHTLEGRQPLILYASQPHFHQTTTIPGIMGEGTGGVTEIFKRRIVLPLGPSLEETDHIIGHEMVHAFQYDMSTQGLPKFALPATPMLRAPLWLIEGLAEYLSIGPEDPHTAMWMRDAWRQKKLPSIKKLRNPRFFPYRYGQSLWAFITGTWGDGTVSIIMKSVSRTGDYVTAFRRALGKSPAEVTKLWHDSMEKAYAPLYEDTDKGKPAGKLIIQGTEEKRLNISPAVSPNGKQFVFLSTRDLFAVDMYLSETKTGKIKKKLTRTAVDQKFESLQFIKSTGSWSLDGSRFAFGAVKKGRPALTIMDMPRGRIQDEIFFEDLGEILNPTWSPDGRQIAFSALEGGFSDLFIYNLTTKKRTRLTHDAYADLYPVWSPNGKVIAYVTDRFTTDLKNLDPGNYQIALLESESRRTVHVAGFNKGKNTNPQWAPDGKSLYFLSDQSGISNIYRYEINSRKVYQVTRLFTGTTGITDLSPAFTVAQQTGRLIYCTYEKENYNIYSLEKPEETAGRLEITPYEGPFPSLLPPREKAEGHVHALLHNPLFGLPEESSFEITEYHPKLKLDYATPPQVAIGVDRFGTYAGGGLSFFWSDMLGIHNLATMFQANTHLIDTAGLVGYQNSHSRFNWGLAAQRIPYVIGGYSLSMDEVAGEPVYLEEELLYRQINYQLSLFASYPFSQMKRFEISTGYSLIDFDQEVWRRAYSMATGLLLMQGKEKLPSSKSLHLGILSAALVFDSSVFGATSPVFGQSYRFEVSPFVGSINYTSLLADFRKYWMIRRPFTLAFRILHYGRYGSGGEDSRLWPLFLGYETLVRGYDYYSITSEEFETEENGFDFDSLFGSKILVANIELRFPILGLLGIGHGFYGSLPLECILFYDTGLAWDSTHQPWFMDGKRKPLSSTGFGLRMNIMGYFVVGLNLVRPLDRPQKGWYLQFSFMPGF